MRVSLVPLFVENDLYRTAATPKGIKRPLWNLVALQRFLALLLACFEGRLKLPASGKIGAP